MKINGIDRALTTPMSVALITEPPIDRDILLQIHMMTDPNLRSPLEPPTPLLTSLRLMMQNGRLIVHTGNFDAHIAENIESLLEEAEKRANKTNQSREENARKATQAYQSQKQALIEFASSVLKLPPK